MLATGLNRTWAQMLHPKFRKVFLVAVFAALITLIVLIYALYEFWPSEYTTGIEWLDQGGFTMIVTLASYILFPPVATTVMSLMSDQIADAVEEDYYPHRKGTRKVPVSEAIISGLKLTLIIIIFNVLALVPYIFLLVVSGGVGTLLLFLMLNGFLLGREYYEIVGMRHLPRAPLHLFRREHSSQIFLAGILIAGMFMVPILNIVAPIIGAALMTHMFQLLADKHGFQLKRDYT